LGRHRVRIPSPTSHSPKEKGEKIKKVTTGRRQEKTSRKGGGTHALRMEFLGGAAKETAKVDDG
jgi:hypothetical protein